MQLWADRVGGGGWGALEEGYEPSMTKALLSSHLSCPFFVPVTEQR